MKNRRALKLLDFFAFYRLNVFNHNATAPLQFNNWHAWVGVWSKYRRTIAKKGGGFWTNKKCASSAFHFDWIRASDARLTAASCLISLIDDKKRQTKEIKRNIIRMKNDPAYLTEAKNTNSLHHRPQICEQCFGFHSVWVSSRNNNNSRRRHERRVISNNASTATPNGEKKHAQEWRPHWTRVFRSLQKYPILPIDSGNAALRLYGSIAFADIPHAAFWARIHAQWK